MKVLLFSLLSAIAGIAIYAENPVGYSYTPLVREGVEWGYKWTYYPLKEGSYYLQLSGDTLINSKTYKVCYRYATVDFQKEDAMVYGFVREEGKRIYAIGRRVPNGTSIDMYNYYDKDALEERLIYDLTGKSVIHIDLQQTSHTSPSLGLNMWRSTEKSERRFLQPSTGLLPKVFLPLKGLDSSAADRLRQT